MNDDYSELVISQSLLDDIFVIRYLQDLSREAVIVYLWLNMTAGDKEFDADSVKSYRVIPEAKVKETLTELLGAKLIRESKDKFVLEDLKRREVEEYVNICKAKGDVSIALGGSVEKDSRNVRMALRLADERMYENKQKYYSRFEVSKKGRGRERSAKESELVRRMNYDQLTGLPSMTFFFKLAENAREKMHAGGIDSAVLFLSLCGMGDYNKK